MSQVRSVVPARLYSTKTPQSTDPVTDVKGARDTFSNEKDWQSRVLSIKVPSAGGTP
jgi:hypothetical protein